jgi:hypothetical protein
MLQVSLSYDMITIDEVNKNTKTKIKPISFIT